jgi:cytochrome c553
LLELPWANCEGNAQAGFPRIAGQSYAYLLHQLDSYANETRTNPVMQPIAKAMSGQQRQAGAAYYASLSASAPATPESSGGNVERGRRLATIGDDSKLVQGCANCHGADGAGSGWAYPYLAGQHASYLVNTLAAWRDGSRRNDPSGQMIIIGKSLDDQDAQAVAAYYSRLPPPAASRDADVATTVAYAASAVVSGPRTTGTQAGQGVGAEPSAITGGQQGPGGGGGGSGGGPSGSPSGQSTTIPATGAASAASR